MFWERRPFDPAPEEALDLMRERRCSYRPLTFFPGPDVKLPDYPIEVFAPPGFHFADHQHRFLLWTWEDIAERLDTTPLVPCDEDCDV